MPTHKVGVKLLTDEQMRNVFSSYVSLLERIENHREKIGKLTGKKLKHYQYNMMYDNVFSIFGNRGTGKTSVAFTLQKEFEENETHPYDLVMPIIIPEVIPPDGSVLGWILESIKEDVLDMFNDGQSQSCAKGKNDFWEKCKYQADSSIYGTLRKNFEELEELYYSIKYNPGVESSYTMAVGNSAKQAGNYNKFSRKISEFWDCLVEAIRYKNKQLQRDGDFPDRMISPLVYFIFDDVDLAPEKVHELLSVIIKYLSHPNIIVITTADEETVLEVIENIQDIKIGRLPKEWRHYLNKYEDIKNVIEIGTEKQDLIGKMARLYLGKVLPTSTRYYLKLFERTDEKWRFYIEEKKQLGEVIVDKLDEMLKELEVNSSNFLKVEDVEIDFYLNYFGNTSRQIANTFLSVQEFLEEVKKLLLRKRERELEEKDMGVLYERCRHFLQIAITANHNLAETTGKVENFVDEVFWLEHNNWRLYFDYEYLRSFLEELLLVEKKENVIRTTLQLYSLLMFAENIFVIIENWAKGRVTGRRRIHGIPGMAQFLDEQVFQGRQMFRTDWSAEEFFRHYNIALNRICYLSKKEGSLAKLDREYLYYFLSYSYEKKDVDKKALLLLFEKNRSWLREMARILSMVYGNIYLIGTKEIRNCQVYRERYGLSKYQRTIEDILEKNMRECLREFDIKGKLIKEFKISEGVPKRLNNEESINFAEVLRRKLFEEVIESIISKLYVEYLADHKSDTEESEGLEESEDIEENEEFWDFYDKREHSVYQKDKVLPLHKIIEIIDRQCEEDSLEKLLSKLPEAMAREMEKFLRGKMSREKLLLALHVVQDFLVRWDTKQHSIVFENFRNFMYHAENVGRKRSDFRGILTISDQIQEYTSDLLLNERRKYLRNTTFYVALREELRNMCILLNADRDSSKDSREGLYISLNTLGRGIDVAIDLEDKDAYGDAVAVGLVVQVIKRLQKLYLHQSIVEKYQLESGNSSMRLERVKTEGENGETVWKETFYYAMFRTMKQISENTETLESESERIKEEDALKNLILGAAWEEKNQYLTRVIKEVKNESNAD